MKLMLAGCILRNDQGKILLLHRNTAKRQQWEIPGGKVEPSEDYAQAAMREVKEELGIEVGIIKLLGIRDFTEHNLQMSYAYYQAIIMSGEPAIMESDTFDDMRYFTKKDMALADISLGARNFLRLTRR